MPRTAAHVRTLSIAFTLFVTGCGGGSSRGTDAAVAGSRQDAAAPAPKLPTVQAPAGATFRNPLRASGPDPYVVQANGVYYYTQTSGDRIALWSTTAMSRLADATAVTIFVPQRTGPNSRDLWAPELHRLDGRWYVYYAAGDGSRAAGDPYPSQRMFVLENDGADPTQGTWKDLGPVRGAIANAWSIDGTVLEHGGQRYFVWSGRASASDPDQHLYVATMANPWTLVGDPVAISSPDHAWERAGRAGVNEGPQLLEGPRGDLFLLYSANGCWTDDYALGLLTLRAGGDPLVATDWIKNDRPVFTKNAAGGAFGPGHNGFFKSPDGTQDWMIYHANATAGAGCGDARSPRMQPLRWRDDGTPDFGAPVAVGAPITVPSGEPPAP